MGSQGITAQRMAWLDEMGEEGIAEEVLEMGGNEEDLAFLKQGASNTLTCALHLSFLSLSRVSGNKISFFAFRASVVRSETDCASLSATSSKPEKKKKATVDVAQVSTSCITLPEPRIATIYRCQTASILRPFVSFLRVTP